MAAGIRAGAAQHGQAEAGRLEKSPPRRHPAHRALAGVGRSALADTPPVISAPHLKIAPPQRATLHHAPSINRHHQEPSRSFLSSRPDPFVVASKRYEVVQPLPAWIIAGRGVMMDLSAGSAVQAASKRGQGRPHDRLTATALRETVMGATEPLYSAQPRPTSPS